MEKEGRKNGKDDKWERKQKKKENTVRKEGNV